MLHTSENLSTNKSKTVEHLAVGLKRNGSWNGGGSVHASNTNHGQSSILDFGTASLGELLGALVLAETKGIKDSWAHALETTRKRRKSVEDHFDSCPLSGTFILLTFPGVPPLM